MTASVVMSLEPIYRLIENGCLLSQGIVIKYLHIVFVEPFCM